MEKVGILMKRYVLKQKRVTPNPLFAESHFWLQKQIQAQKLLLPQKVQKANFLGKKC